MPRRKWRKRQNGEEIFFIAFVLFGLSLVLGASMIYAELQKEHQPTTIPTQQYESKLEVQGEGSEAPKGVGGMLQGGTDAKVQQSGNTQQNLHDNDAGSASLQPGAKENRFQ